MSPAAVATGAYFSLRESVSRPVQTTLPTLFNSIWPHEWPHAEVIRALNRAVLSHSVGTGGLPPGAGSPDDDLCLSTSGEANGQDRHYDQGSWGPSQMPAEAQPPHRRWYSARARALARSVSRLTVVSVIASVTAQASALM